MMDDGSDDVVGIGRVSDAMHVRKSERASGLVSVVDVAMVRSRGLRRRWIYESSTDSLLGLLLVNCSVRWL